MFRCIAIGVLVVALSPAPAAAQPVPRRDAPPASPTSAPTQPSTRPLLSGEKPILLYFSLWSVRLSPPLYAVKLDPLTGRFIDIALAVKPADKMRPWNRSFVLHPKKPVLYMSTWLPKEGETRMGLRVRLDPQRERRSCVTALRIDPETGKLSYFNEQTHKGQVVAYVTMDDGGANLYACNRSDMLVDDARGLLNSVNVFPIDEETGALLPATDHLRLYETLTYELPGQAPQRTMPVPDWQWFAGWRYLLFFGGGGAVRIQESGADAVFPGLGGGGDRLLQEHRRRREQARDEQGRDRDREEQLDAEAMRKANNLERLALPRDTGASWVAFHPGGKYFYVRAAFAPIITVYEASGDITSARQIEQHRLERPERNLSAYGIQRRGGGISGKAVHGEVHIHPNGRFLYAACRDQGIAIFRIDEGTGRLAPIGRAPDPLEIGRSFSIDPDGRVLVTTAQRTAGSVFSIDSTFCASLGVYTGTRSPGGENPREDEENLGGFASFLIDQETGLLTLADHSPNGYPTEYIRFAPKYEEQELKRSANSSRTTPGRRSVKPRISKP